MKYLTSVILLVLGLSLRDNVKDDITELCFPRDDDTCLSNYIDHIKKSETSIHMAAYAFGSEEIAQALKENEKASKFIILDKFTTKSAFGRKILDILNTTRKITVYEYEPVSPTSIMHNKFTIFDEFEMETGSANYAGNAFKNNFENLLYFLSPHVINEYLLQFDHIAEKYCNIIIKNDARLDANPSEKQEKRKKGEKKFRKKEKKLINDYARDGEDKKFL